MAILVLQEVDLAPDAPPNNDDKVCPELPHCGLNCDFVKDEDGCSVCACQTSPRYPLSNDTAQTSGDRRVCPELKCDLHCERGLVMDENDCTFCECKPPAAGCPTLVGCRKRCSFGYRTNKRGCPVSVFYVSDRSRVIFLNRRAVFTRQSFTADLRQRKVVNRYIYAFFADMSLSSLVHGSLERDAPGRIDLASE